MIMRNKFRYIFSSILKLFGFLFALILLISFTSLPYYAYHQLAAVDITLEKEPRAIIVLSGVGMPSPDALIKLYFASKAAKQFPNSSIYIALPEKASKDSITPLKQMKLELMKNQIISDRIHLAPNGHNTYTQLLDLSKKVDQSASVLIVTSPEHMLRSILTLKKLGFSDVGGLPTFEEPSEEVLLRAKSPKKDEVESLALRYNMWSYLQYEIKVAREYCAISYYWIKGWI